MGSSQYIAPPIFSVTITLNIPHPVGRSKRKKADNLGLSQGLMSKMELLVELKCRVLK